ncbi:uncharacterized protein LOC135211279 [Macrobrachium nipponense]|uniref:uncharacterized protein LOC135211279 n=1 Tax=Macrobrachium nipponense TaxID=159736 RepID=UPI0030C86FC3
MTDMEPQRIQEQEVTTKMEATEDLRKKRTKEDDDDQEWTTVTSKRTRKQEKKTSFKENAPEKNANGNQIREKMTHFRVTANNSAEGFRAIAAFQTRFKNLQFQAKPNKQGQWTISSRDTKTIITLRNTTAINIKELKEEERIKKAVVVGYPLEMPESHLTSAANVTAAIRMKNKQGILTKAVLVTFVGTIPERVDLGVFGRYGVKTYYPEPLRCFKCQKFGHHKSQCQAKQETCAICSRKHPTEDCIAKRKAGETTTLKCPNCGKAHIAMAWGCPERLRQE